MFVSAFGDNAIEVIFFGGNKVVHSLTVDLPFPTSSARVRPGTGDVDASRAGSRQPPSAPGDPRVSRRRNYLPTMMTLNVFGSMSAWLYPWPNVAVSRRISCVFVSRAIVRAPGAVETVWITRKSLGEYS